MRRMPSLPKDEGVAMMLLCGQSNRVWHYLAGRCPGKVGVLVSPSYFDKVPIDDWMPCALDNDAFGAWVHGKTWDLQAWLAMLSSIATRRIRPIWATVPDVVANRDETLRLWSVHAESVLCRGWDAAFVVQDGMSPRDVPTQASVVFIGGTDGWKFPSLRMWTEHFPRVHCARVNSIEMMEACEMAGCESIDGTGWFRDLARWPKVRAFIEGRRRRTTQPELWTPPLPEGVRL